jgi:hypothetical protein
MVAPIQNVVDWTISSTESFRRDHSTGPFFGRPPTRIGERANVISNVQETF